MEDLSILRDQETALALAIAELRQKERHLIKAQTFAEQIEIARADSSKHEQTLSETTARLKDLKQKKAALLQEVCGPLSDAITMFLPAGEGIITLDDNKLGVHWRDPEEKVVPYHSLSGGERIAFDAALSNALLGGSANKVLILEAAELDKNNLSRTLRNVVENHPDAQIIVNTCHGLELTPEGWEIALL